MPMKIRYDSSFKRGRVEFIAYGGLEIDVPDDLGQLLMRQDERWKPASEASIPAAEPETPGAPAEAEPAAEKKPKRKRTIRKKSAARKSTAK
jgi:hypothetical protein